MRNWLKALALLPLLLFAAPAAIAAPTVNEFNVPTGASEPEDIVAGPDGKLWFTEHAADKLGRVTPGNPPVIDEFPLPTGYTQPVQHHRGPRREDLGDGEQRRRRGGAHRSVEHRRLCRARRLRPAGHSRRYRRGSRWHTSGSARRAARSPGSTQPP